MEDDELTRAGRALRGADPEIDLSRVYAESWSRARGTETHEGWAPDDRVEVVLHGTGRDGRRVRRLVRRGPALAWGIVAAAAAAAVALVVGVSGLPAPGTVPGSVPSAGISATTDTGRTPGTEPTVGLTPASVLDRAADAVAAAGCGMKIRSTLGDKSTFGAYDSATAGDGATDTETPTSTPTPDPLGERPLDVLQAEAIAAVLGLSGLVGADYRLHPDLTVEQDDGATLARLRFAPPGGLVVGGDVTRMDLLVDLTTWLPHSTRTWARAENGTNYELLSEFRWTTCDGASPPR